MLQRVNITNFRNCDLDPSENLEQYVSFTDISYEFNSDGLCDIVHGTYNIPTVNTADKLVINFRNVLNAFIFMY